jgi:peptide/nickel transport system substrate-binding protein
MKSTSHSRLTQLLSSLGLAAVVVVVATACTGPAEESPSTLRIGEDSTSLVQDFGLNRLGMYPATVAAGAVYESLFTNGSGDEFDPLLATGYERSDDWKTLTVKLRDDVTFTDGERLTASGLKEYLTGLAALEDWGTKPLWDTHAPELTVRDDTTLVIHSEVPFDFRVLGLAYSLFISLPIASPSALVDLAASAATPVGSGPYVVESITPEVSMSFVRNDDYRDPEAYPYDRIEIIVLDDEIARLNALTSGQIDAASLSFALSAEAEKAGFVRTYGDDEHSLNPALIVMDRNGTVAAPLADQRVRQAIALAFDRDAINEAVNFGLGTAKSQMYVEGQDEYVPGGDDRYGYDPERAGELMAEAGYPGGFDLTILSSTYLATDSWHPIVSQYLGDIGIRVTFETAPTLGSFIEDLYTSAYPVALWVDEPIQTSELYMAPGGFFDPFAVQDPVVGGLWSSILGGPDDAAAEAGAELGEYALDQAFISVFASYPVVWVTAPGIAVTNERTPLGRYVYLHQIVPAS